MIPFYSYLLNITFNKNVWRYPSHDTLLKTLKCYEKVIYKNIVRNNFNNNVLTYYIIQIHIMPYTIIKMSITSITPGIVLNIKYKKLLLLINFIFGFV